MAPPTSRPTSPASSPAGPSCAMSAPAITLRRPTGSWSVSTSRSSTSTSTGSRSPTAKPSSMRSKATGTSSTASDPTRTWTSAGRWTSTSRHRATTYLRPQVSKKVEAGHTRLASSAQVPRHENGGDLFVQLARGLGGLGDAGDTHLAVLAQGAEQVEGDAGGGGRVVGQAPAVDLGDDAGGRGTHEGLVLEVVGGDVRPRSPGGDELTGCGLVGPAGHEARHPEGVGGAPH